jgi:hypothetical protein
MVCWRQGHYRGRAGARKEHQETMGRKHPDVPFVIDFHTHMLDDELRRTCTNRNAITGFGQKTAQASSDLRKFLDPETQIADMDERGIDMHVVFTGPLKVVVPHGGGYFPTYMRRLDRNILEPEAVANIKGGPSDYLRHFYYDTCVYL